MNIFIIVLLIAAKSCLVASSDSHECSHEAAHFKVFRKTYTNYKIFTKNCEFCSIRRAGYFTRVLPTALIIPGVKADYSSEITQTLVDAFLFRKDHNVIFADYGTYASDDYAEVALEVDHIARVFVDLLNEMMDDGYDLTQVYIIGHGLGAHIAGRVGKLLQYQRIMLSRITGLDPSRSLYDIQAFKHKVFSISPSNYIPLSKDDAKFVDIIHTNAGFYRGMIVPEGHLDFWPNHGVFQPHCDQCKISNIFSDWKECSKCSHDASWRYYAESVKSPVPLFEAKRCDNKIFVSFFCSGDTTFMGYYASPDAEHGNYFVETNDNPPYSK